MDNVVALANTEKRVVALGLEDNGTVTGVGREHRSVDGLSVFIFFSKTVPQVVVRAEIIHADNGLPVACIEVDRNLQIGRILMVVATSLLTVGVDGIGWC